MNKLFFCRFIFYDVGVKSYIFCDWQLHIFFVLWQLNKSMFLVFRFRERAIYHPYASSKVLHFSFPLVYLISLVIFREATLKPKNCLVLSVPLTGIWSTRYFGWLMEQSPLHFGFFQSMPRWHRSIFLMILRFVFLILTEPSWLLFFLLLQDCIGFGMGILHTGICRTKLVWNLFV